MTPEKTLKRMGAYLAELEAAKRMSVKVGLPKEKVGDKVYGDGTTIMVVGASHEYGAINTPQRSFLRMPFDVHKKEVSEFIRGEFSKVFDGKSTAESALGRVGIKAMNISRGAFSTNGYGQWAALANSTIVAKAKAGKTTPLVWSGILRGSITWVVV